MTLQLRKTPQYRPLKDIEVEWDSFNGGWNNLFKPTELRPNELAQSDNLMLIGAGTPTGRWGSLAYNLNGGGRVRLLDAYYNSNTSTNYLLVITDQGYLVKKSGASYQIVTGASFASGQNYQSTELAFNTYIASASLPLVRFDGNNLIPYISLSAPTNVSVAQISAASGFSTYSWIITANSLSGETIGSVNKVLASLPLNLALTAVRVSWNTVSAAASVLTGYNVYRGFPGQEMYLASLDQSATNYTDYGAPTGSKLAPVVDTSAGPPAKYILKFDDRLILAGIQGFPNLILISGRYPFHDRFTALDGGGYTYVQPNDGDYITGLGISNQQTQSPVITIFKNRSVHAMTLPTIVISSFVVVDPIVHMLTSSNGSSSGDSVTQVENDTFYFGTRGLFSIGLESGFLNQIRTNEISARIRPYVQGLNNTDFQECSASYLDYKYILSFPTRHETIIFDRQRTCFMGPWKTPFGITKWLRYFDAAGVETWLAGCDDGYNRQFTPSQITDSGTAIYKIGRTKKESFSKWSTFKIIKYFYFLLRNVRGSITVNLIIEDRSGNSTTTKTATVTSQLGNGGWGGDQFGDQQWGQTNALLVLTGDELVRFSPIFKQLRVMQVEFKTTDANSNFEFLGIRATAQDLGPASLPAADKV